MNARNLTFIGVLTWAIIAIPAATTQWEKHVLFSSRGVAWMACYGAFIVLFVIATREDCGRWRMPIAAVESVLALTCIALEPSGLQPILLVIIAGQLGALSTRVAVVWITVQTAILWFVTSSSSMSVWLVLAYFAFQLFGAFTLRIAHQEFDARQALAEANAELQVATGLLDISSRTEERLRIARDLHDLLGHHLTALSLNLEVASHLAQGEAREQIEKTKALTRVLLSDVREVVSRLRHNDPVDLTAALHALQSVVDRPVINVEIGNDVTVTDPLIAQVVLRTVQEIVTNAVRHSGARNLWLKLSAEDRALALAARDDGSGTDHVSFGNGLRGMRERIEQIHGTMHVASMRGEGFEVNVRIPLQESNA